MYRFLSFDGVDLPAHKTVDDLSSAVSESSIMQAINGNVDALGNMQSNAKTQTIEYTGIYTASEFSINDPGILISEDNYFLIDDIGDFLVEASANLISFVDVWRERRGKRSLLIRQRDSDNAIHCVWARLVLFEFKREVVNANAVAYVRFVFELTNQSWSGMLLNTVSSALTVDTTTNVAVTVNGSHTVADCVIAITATDYIYGIDIAIGSSQLLQWAYASPPVFPTKTIIFDCGKFTVTEDGATRYIGFNLGVGHTIQNWLELSPGSNTISITLDGGGGTAVVTFYDSYP